MLKCIYEDDGICGRSTSQHHCKKVTNPICSICDLYQNKIELTEKQKFKNLIQQAIDSIECNDVSSAMLILEKAMKI